MNKAESLTVHELQDYVTQLWHKYSNISYLSPKEQQEIQQNLITVANWCKNSKNHSQNIIQELYKMLYIHVEELLNSKNWTKLANH